MSSPTSPRPEPPAALARPPVLLADATWWGTLAAARDIGGRGVAVTLASESRVAPARWSKAVRETVFCPGTRDPGRLLDWLLDFGRRRPGHVLYPTSDETAWVISAHREELAAYFRLYSPPMEALIGLLDKERLSALARGAGLRAPESWTPVDEEEAGRLAAEVRFPLYVKPRVQVFSTSRGKGERVDRRSDLRPAWRKWRGLARYPAEVAERLPGVERPLLQASFPATEKIYTVDGFVDATAERWASRGCVKILQRPRGSGPGVCFEEVSVPDPIDRGLRRLFREAGFYGVFDAEFIEGDGEWQLIDVNPRFYNHMAFEIERGLPLAWLAYLAAIRDDEALRPLLEGAAAAPPRPRAFVHRLPFHLMLRLQPLVGAMSRADRERWRSWFDSHRSACTDPVRQDRDPGPAIAELGLELGRFLEHPRAWFRQLAAPGPGAGGA